MHASSLFLSIFLAGAWLGATRPVPTGGQLTSNSHAGDVRNWREYVEIETTPLRSGGYMSRIRNKKARRLLVSAHIQSADWQRDCEYRIGPNGETLAGYYTFRPTFTVKAISYY